MKSEKRTKNDRLMGFDTDKISNEEAQLYSRYLELMCLINETLPKSIFDLKNKIKRKKYQEEMDQTLDKLDKGKFWTKVIRIS
jgi:hypothetical protein